MRRTIEILIYPNFQILDVTGPIAAFEIAEIHAPRSYDVRIVADVPGPIKSSSGFALVAGKLSRSRQLDTLLVSGGIGVLAQTGNARLRSYIRRRAAIARRTASICSGSFLLADAGLLDGRSATTHWSRAAEFARMHPRVRLDPDRIHVRDGRLWTSAGITAGIDLALALIGADLGEEIARVVAQHLVVYYQRPGGQSQFSPLLQLGKADGRFAGLISYIRTNLTKRLDVPELARVACMSERHFSRQFLAEIGESPAKAVERIRVDAARTAIESGAGSIQRVAHQTGFINSERMRRSFLRILGASPSTMRRRNVASTARERKGRH